MAKGIQAAGGVVWRPADSATGVELALIHRRRQRDWSLPKGKARAGELPVETALREVLEETGHHAEVGPFLGAVNYRKRGAPKVVRYWSMAATGGSFVANGETDDLLWLEPEAACRLMSARNIEVIGWFRRLLRTPAVLSSGSLEPGSPYLVRHGPGNRAGRAPGLLRAAGRPATG